jgi:hypothetical protein
MLPCSQCSKEMPSETALLTPAISDKPLAFRSGACQDSWIRQLFTPLSKRPTAPPLWSAVSMFVHNFLGL